MIDRIYEEPFLVNYQRTWLHAPVENVTLGEQFKAVAYFRNGTVCEVVETVK